MLPWVQLLTAVISGIGLYLFCRRALGVGYWAAVIPAWCYPMTGFFVFWRGFPTCGAVFWFPWLLLAVDQTIRRRNCTALIGLSAATCLTLISGHVDVAGQALLASGLYTIWCFCKLVRQTMVSKRGAIGIRYARGRMEPGILSRCATLTPDARVCADRRADWNIEAVGTKERPPAGISELPLTVLPDPVRGKAPRKQAPRARQPN